MENMHVTFTTIRNNTAASRPENVKSVLILYEEQIFNLGDCCIRFNKLRCFRSFFTNASVEINFTDPGNQKYYDGLLKNNPHLDRISTNSWNDIDFSCYDMVICIAYNEQRLLDFLHEKYGAAINGKQWKPGVISISKLILNPVPEADAKYIFPVNSSLVSHLKAPQPGELYISNDEQQWADEWLEAQGMKKGERLFIIVDSTLRRDKMVNFDVYYEFFTFLLGMKNTKVLIFDEKGLGKESFYKDFVGERLFSKIIFSKGLGLRQDLAIIASSYTKLVFGPCSGLLHCASSIYNNFVRCGMPLPDAPLLITYTGKYYADEKNAWTWWGTSPLMNCLILRERNGIKKMCVLNELHESEKQVNDPLPCSAYTSKMLIDFVTRKLQPVAASLAMAATLL
jgi:hypothetical protein